MKKTIILITGMAFLLLLASTALAGAKKTVYLKDGSEIDCLSARIVGESVSVRINRDTIIDLTRAEVDLKKTFPKSEGAKLGKRRGEPVKASSSPSEEKGVNASAAAAKPAEASVKPQAAAGAPNAAAPKTAAPAATPPPQAAPVAKPAPVTPKPKIEAEPPPTTLSTTAGIGSLVGILLVTVFLIASFWKVFVKAGVPGWKSIVPIYNLFVLVEISGRPWWWFLLLFIPVVNIIILILVHISLAARFGKGALFGVGLALLGMIFFPILAFDKSTYD